MTPVCANAGAAVDSLAPLPRRSAPRADLAQHAGLSCVLAAGATLATREPGLAVAGTVAFGAGKEWGDRRRRRGRFSWSDLAADVAGAALGAWVAHQLRH